MFSGTVAGVILKRLTPDLLISPVYQPFVSDFTARVAATLSDNLHSLYICGSIPRGRAVPGKSDADFTIVTNSEMSPTERDAIDVLKKELLGRYPFVTKIDTPTCTVGQVMSEQYNWGFWVGIVSHCISGSDLAEALDPLTSPGELMRGLCADTAESVSAMVAALRTETQPELRQAHGEKLMRRLVRALVALTVIDTDEWTDDPEKSERVLLACYPHQADLIGRVFRYYRTPVDDTESLVGLATEVLVLFESEYARLTSR